MPSSPDNAWFRRRKYGIGWALQRTWQGWVLMLGYVAVAAVGATWLRQYPQALSAYLTVLTALAVLLCWWKGERSLWRGR